MLHTLIPSLADCGKVPRSKITWESKNYFFIALPWFRSCAVLITCYIDPRGVDYCHFYSYQLIDSSLEIADL